MKFGQFMSYSKGNDFIKNHTCEEGGVHLRFFAFIDELEKQIIVKKSVEVGQ